MEWICAGAALWLFLAVLGLLVLTGLVVLLVKLGVIVHYAAKPQDSEVGAEYELNQSKDMGEEKREGHG